MSEKESEQTGTANKSNSQENPWLVTKGLRHVFEELIPEAADVLMSDNKSPVMVTGPTGVGKTYVTQEITKRAGIPQVRVKRVICASFTPTPTLADSEFFGHVKGAFSGALHETTGVLTDPEHDLIILEGIGTLPKDIRAKLLAFIATGEFRKVGSRVSETVEKLPKIIGVTNSRPDSIDFTEDFLYRFHVIEIPGLHQRRHDIPELLEYFVPGFHWSTLDVLRLMCYNWPGNVPQLRNLTYLVQKYNDKISDWGWGTALEWFDHRFTTRLSLMARGAGTLGVPHMKGIRYFLKCLMKKDGFGEKIGIQVPKFSLFSEEGAATTMSRFKSKDLEVAWDKWCYIVSQDKFADRDLWECLITRERTAFLDPREGNFDDFGLSYLAPYDMATCALAEDFSKEWYQEPEPSVQTPPEIGQALLDVHAEEIHVSGLKTDIGVVPTGSCPEFLTADEWASYQRKMMDVRIGKYTDKQAHYWRSRTVFRYLNADANKERMTKLGFIQKSLQKIYPDIIQFGCEQVPYDSCDVEQWIVDPCPLPDANDKKPKPWEDTKSNKSQEAQMKRRSRLRECVQSIALIMFSRNTGLTNEAFIQMCSQEYLKNILDSVGERSLPETEAWHLEEKNVRLWVKELISSIRPVSKKK